MRTTLVSDATGRKLIPGYSVDQPDAPVRMLGYNRADPNAGNTTEMAEPSDAPKSPVGREFES